MHTLCEKLSTTFHIELIIEYSISTHPFVLLFLHFSSFRGHITRHSFALIISLLLVHQLFSQIPLSRQTVTTIVA